MTSNSDDRPSKSPPLSGHAPGGLLSGAEAALLAGSLNEAEVTIREFLSMEPGRPEAWELLATILERRGRVDEAIQVLGDATRALPLAARLFNALGLLLASSGRKNASETAFRQALNVDPTRADAAANLGDLLMLQSRYEEAEVFYRKVVSYAPSDPRHLMKYARVMLALKRESDALRVLARVIDWGRATVRGGKTLHQASTAQLEFYYDALSQLAAISISEGRPNEALWLLNEAIVHGSRGAAINAQFANYFCATKFNVPRPDLKPLLARAFRESWTVPMDLVRSAIPLLLIESPFREVLHGIAADKDTSAPNTLDSPDIESVVTDELLLAILNEALVTDPTLEHLLIALRSTFLRAQMERGVAKSERAELFKPFVVALANQCFTNEYAFAESSWEQSAVTEIENRIKSAVKNFGAIDDFDLAVLASYRPLNRLSCAAELLARVRAPSLESIITRQLVEPTRELELKSTLPRLTEITDLTSRSVREQYEENPYPRWLRTPSALRRYTLEEWLKLHFPHLPLSGRDPNKPLEVLVAGCGTGQDAIASAQRFRAANVLAVDLSLTSLAYAARKTEELAVANVTYAQADILGLTVLGPRFDVIECAGVLHHLADPLAGWKVLCDLCVAGGYMLMALYSEQGREDLKPATEFIARGGYGTSESELRRFRSDILALDPSHHARQLVSTRDDFYSLSMLRDLLFHVQEQRFTIPVIAQALKTLELQFCGFGVTPAVRAQVENRFGPSTDFSSLDLWHTFEVENPLTFSSMYHFVVRKPPLSQ